MKMEDGIWKVSLIELNAEVKYNECKAMNMKEIKRMEWT